MGEQFGTEIDPTKLITFGEDGSLAVTSGYDDVTGLGEPSLSFVARLGQR